MAEFTPVQVRTFGDKARAAKLAGFAGKVLNDLKTFMSFRNIRIAGPWVRRGDGFTVIVKSLAGIKDYIDIYIDYSPVAQITEPTGVGEAMLFFWGFGYERIDFSYSEGSALFTPGAVTCSSGYGNAEFVFGNRLLGEFVRCWDPGGSISGTNGASGIITNCRREYFADTYNVRHLLAEFDYSLPAKKAASPSDSLNIDCHMNAGNKAFSKTLNRITVEGFEYGDLSYQLTWVLCAKYNGKLVVFPGGDTMFNPSDFIRTRLRLVSGLWRLQTLEVLFDVWEEGGALYLGAVGQTYAYIWTVDSDGVATLVCQKALLSLGFEPRESTPANYIPSVCGYHKWHVFVNRDGYGIVTEQIVPAGTNEITGTNGLSKDIEGTIWNHLNEKLYYVADGASYAVDPYYELFVIGQYAAFYATGWWCTCYYTMPGLGLISDNCAPYWECTKFGTMGLQTLTKYGASVSYPVFSGVIWGISVDKFNYTVTDVELHLVNRTRYGDYKIIQMDEEESIDYAVFDKGYNDIRSRGGYRYTNYQTVEDSNWALSDLCISTRTDFTLQGWNIMPDGLAYDVDAHKVDWCDPGQNSMNSGGDQGLIFLEYDEWEAWLKEAVDRNKQPIRPQVAAYRRMIDDKIILVTGPVEGVVLSHEEVGDGDRAFFQYVRGVEEV